MAAPLSDTARQLLVDLWWESTRFKYLSGDNYESYVELISRSFVRLDGGRIVLTDRGNENAYELIQQGDFQ